MGNYLNVKSSCRAFSYGFTISARYSDGVQFFAFLKQRLKEAMLPKPD